LAIAGIDCGIGWGCTGLEDVSVVVNGMAVSNIVESDYAIVRLT
jgi:hypothetical protein